MSCCLECKSEVEKKDLRKKAEEYLSRAEQLKQMIKDNEGSCQRVSVGNSMVAVTVRNSVALCYITLVARFGELCT